ncbi:hypothetical protein BD779DRAFT_1475398 [Infundibulicybe gibba]|nr:hypothetical protein BD779DRAFT_1475398 [Infundibulicybe gibba]
MKLTCILILVATLFGILLSVVYAAPKAIESNGVGIPVAVHLTAALSKPVRSCFLKRLKYVVNWGWPTKYDSARYDSTDAVLVGVLHRALGRVDEGLKETQERTDEAVTEEKLRRDVFDAEGALSGDDVGDSDMYTPPQWPSILSSINGTRKKKDGGGSICVQNRGLFFQKAGPPSRHVGGNMLRNRTPREQLNDILNMVTSGQDGGYMDSVGRRLEDLLVGRNQRNRYCMVNISKAVLGSASSDL